MHITPIEKAVKDCINAKRLANRRPEYVTSLECTLKKFARSRESRLVSSTTSDEVDAWLPVNPGNRKTKMAHLSAFFGFCVRRGYLDRNPIERLDWPRIDPKPPIILSPEDAERLMATVRKIVPSWEPYFIAGLYVGTRPYETERLAWDCLDLERGYLRIDAAASKVRQRRIIKLEPKALALFQGAKGGKFCIGKSAWRYEQRRRIRQAMGWKTFNHDILRHTACSMLVALHGDIGKVARLVGNSPEVLLNRYIELVSEVDCARFWSL